MRNWRKTHPMTPEQRRKGIARSYLEEYVKRGKVERKTECERCGSNIKVQAHHRDYSKPLEVEWICLRCHMIEHYVGFEAVAT